jgi:hypothetical protein
MQQVVAVEIAGRGERIDQREAGPRAIHHRDRNRPVERYDR